MARNSNALTLGERYKDFLPNNNHSVHFGGVYGLQTLYISLNDYGYSRFRQICFEYYDEKNDFVLIPAWSNRGFHDFKHEMYGLAYAMGFDVNNFPDEYSNFSVAEIARFSGIIHVDEVRYWKKLDSIPYSKEIIKMMNIEDLGRLYGLAVLFDKHASFDYLQTFIDTADIVARILIDGLRELGWGV